MILEKYPPHPPGPLFMDLIIGCEVKTEQPVKHIIQQTLVKQRFHIIFPTFFLSTFIYMYVCMDKKL